MEEYFINLLNILKILNLSEKNHLQFYNYPHKYKHNLL